MQTSIENDLEYKQKFLQMAEFVRNLGITVNTNTRARGHQGFFLKNRIDISTDITFERKIEVLIHEFTHYIHYKIDASVHKTGGSLEILFPNSDLKVIEQELFEVTKFVDKNKSLNILNSHRNKILTEIKLLDNKIKSLYPDFKRSSRYSKFEKEIKKTDAKYLLKYDRVKVKTMFLRNTKLYTISSLDDDFPELDEQTRNYIKLKSKQRTLSRISSRIRRLKKYYKRPAELFARFVEALFIDTAAVASLAPVSYDIFCKELANNRYFELADLINNFF